VTVRGTAFSIRENPRVPEMCGIFSRPSPPVCDSEPADLLGFDSHRGLSEVLANKGQLNQKTMMDSNLRSPLHALVARLKGTPYPGRTGNSY
jgi:hypothetical protein